MTRERNEESEEEGQQQRERRERKREREQSHEKIMGCSLNFTFLFFWIVLAFWRLKFGKASSAHQATTPKPFWRMKSTIATKKLWAKTETTR